MSYSPTDKAAISKILEDFQYYLDTSKRFSIVDLPKFGYLKILFYDDDEGMGTATKLNTPADVIHEILWELANDVRDLMIDGEHMSAALSYNEAYELCVRVNTILDKHSPDSDKAYYMQCVEEFIRDYNSR